MNAERLHAILRDVDEDLREHNVPALLDQLSQAMRNLASQPGEASFQNEVNTQRERVISTLRSSPLNELGPVDAQSLQELNLTEDIGDRLAEHIEAVFRDNQLTMAPAADTVAAMASRVREAHDNVSKVLEAFKFFQIGAEDLAPGQFELDVLLPRSAVRSELGRLGEAFVDLEKIVLPFVELTTGSRPPITVESIGSTDFTVFALLTPETARAIAEAISSALGIFERVLAIRDAINKIRSLGLPSESEEESVAPLERQAHDEVSSGLDEVTQSLIERFQVPEVDPGRRHEVTMEVRRSLAKVANRIDEGYYIAVRTGPPLDEEEGDESSVEEGGPPTVAELARQVRELQQQMTFRKLDGGPILTLPEGDGADDTGQGQSTEDDVDTP